MNHTSYGEGEVGEVDRRVSELLSSPLGCAFLVVIDSSNISHSAAAEPSVSIRAAALAAKSVNVHRVDHEEILESVFRRARLLQSLARSILETPSSHWWFEPIARDRQAWVSREGKEPSPDAFVTPKSPLNNWERYAQKSGSGLYTSTIFNGEPSALTAADQGIPDLYFDGPHTSWRLNVKTEARVYEITGPLQWHELCERYPGVGEDGRIVPDWSAVADDWDGVHLTLGGLLTSHLVQIDSDEGWSKLWGWDVEQTLWLRWCFDRVERMEERPLTASPSQLERPW